MYAIVEVGGRQHMMQPDQTLKVDRRPQETGEKITLDRVLAIRDDSGELRVGRPYLENATVTARVVEQGRERKITVVKFKAKKRYRRKIGHRQHFTALEVLSIDADWIEVAPEPEPEAEEPQAEAVEVPEADVSEVEAETEDAEIEADVDVSETEAEDAETEADVSEVEADAEDAETETDADASETETDAEPVETEAGESESEDDSSEMGDDKDGS